MKPNDQNGSGRSTARRHIVAVLNEEIVNNGCCEDFPISSEHQLCRRFEVSRVTVRLALGDLEYRKLIYRVHGKGTYAYGSNARSGPRIGLWIASPDMLSRGGLNEIVRGILTSLVPVRASLALFPTVIKDWRGAKGELAGLIVVKDELSSSEVDLFRKLDLPYVQILETSLEDRACDFFLVGQEAIAALNFMDSPGRLHDSSSDEEKTGHRATVSGKQVESATRLSSLSVRSIRSRADHGS
jgi:hypothetical protein